MTFSVGIWDLTTYAIPGSLYLSLLIYIGDRMDWVSAATIGKVPTAVLIATAAIASYVLGHLSYPLAALLDRYPRDRIATAQAAVRQIFVDRVPGERSSRLVRTNIQLLRTAGEIHHPGAIAEAIRLNALGLMVRGCASAMLLAAPVAALELALGTHKAAAVTLLIFFVVSALAGIRRSRRLRDWAEMKTLEISYWMPEVDTALPPAESPASPTS